MNLCGVCHETSSRLIKEAHCGHEKCRACFIAEENGCVECNRKPPQKRESERSIEKVQAKSKRPTHIIKESESSYSCTICKKKFARNSQYYHFYCDQSINKPFRCSVCKKSFRTSAHLKYHTEEHDSIKFTCDICSKDFAKKTVLMKHMKLHSKVKQKCVECEAVFKDEACYKQHMNNHANIFPHKCTICNKTFNSNSSLKKHRTVIHQASFATSFPCDICGKQFMYKSSFNVHIQTHNKMKKLQECNECQQMFTNQKSFARHLDTHRKKVKYECCVCHITSLRKDNIIRHIRNVHEHKNYDAYYKVVSQQTQKEVQECRTYANSSVIRSIGNVVPVVIKKDRKVENSTTNEQEMIAKTLKKKYNKNYDLYRQILMGSSDDDVTAAGSEKASSSNFSATHWRKKFKENHISESGA